MNGFTHARIFRALCLLLLLLPALRAWGVQATLVADAHVSSAQPTVNAGSLSNLNVGNGYTALMQFDLGVLPAGTTAAQITRATLRVFCNRADTPGLINALAVNGAWTESGVTYATVPALGSSIGSANVSTVGQFVTVDVTSLVQGWVSNPASNDGVALSSSAAVVQFDSKENDETSHQPQLEIALAAGGSGAGAAGATGAVGATGPAGPAGPMGPVGLAGPVGATGAQGAAGAGLIHYLGAYSSGANYNNGDVVTFAGSTYISQVASNLGNTPGFSGTWGLLASVGATGSSGLPGAAGATGPQGPQGFGIQGPAGPVGPAGAPGAQGTPGLVYQGGYSSGTNYAAGDVVIWNGSSYASLIASNHGNTPSLVPGAWGQLTAQGPIGPAGPTGAGGATGAPGSIGPTGPPGERGDQGLQGIPGQAGAQGLPGPAGATGLQGPIGPIGPAGPVGLSFDGPYNSSMNYTLGQGVLWQGAGWVSLVSNNHGNAPDQSPWAWAMFAAPGATGATGPAGVGVAGAPGPVGPQGPAGSVGPAGAMGPQGAAGLNFIGAYSASNSYSPGDAVSYGGSSYVSLASNNHGQTPDQSPAYWSVLAAKGSPGPAGPAGTTGPAGTSGVAGPQGVAGPAGPTGAAGPAGAPGINFRGAWAAGLNYLANDAVTFAGTSYLAMSQNAGQEPDNSPQVWAVLAQAGGLGPAGPQGPTGSAASVSIGTVTTLPAGSQASVTNSGSSTAVVLNFAIPQGSAATGGSGGSTASSSGNPMPAAVYHAVSYAASYYAINTPNGSANEAASVLAWIPRGCTASRLDVFSQQSGAIRVTLRAGGSGALADTPLSCYPSSTTGNCSVSGAFAVDAGEFMDLRIDYSSGAQAGVWTAVECDLAS